MIAYALEAIYGRASAIIAFLQENYSPFRDTIEILIVAALIYALLILVRGTRATQVLIGVAALVAFRGLAAAAELQTLIWIFDNFFAYFPIILAILFADDIRRALARVGRGFVPRLTERQESELLEEIVRACQTLKQRQVGALIVIERESGLDDHVQGGAEIDAIPSKELLVSLFMTNSPLHDGAVLLQHGRLRRAGAILPLTLRTDLPEGVGTRHRAAVGISELTDAVVVVVSEETGSISAVMGGELARDLDAPELRVTLRDYLSRGPGEDEIEDDPEGDGDSDGESAEAESDATASDPNSDEFDSAAVASGRAARS